MQVVFYDDNMAKRKRDNGDIGDKVSDEETSHSSEEKRLKVPSTVDEVQDNSESSLATDDSTQPEVSQSCTRGRPLKRTEISSDSEDKPELASQKSLDGEDSASDKGSTMEETNSHLYQELLDAVLKMKDGNGRMVCELFLKVPPRQKYPEYYKLIKEPIDLKMIYSRLKNNMYSSLDDIEKDLQLLVKNAHAFNEPGSQVYKDATAIKKTVSVKRQEIEHTLSGAKSSKRLRSKRATSKMTSAINALLSDTDDDDEMQADTSQLLDEEENEKNNGEQLEDDTHDPFLALYNSVRRYSDYSGRIVSEAFMRLPSKRTYPDYYEVIKNPIGLLRIGSNIKNGLYESLDTLAAEMNRCFENAKAYNETESMLYQDAITLQDVLQTKKTDIEKISLEKGIDLTRSVKKIPRHSDHAQSEDADVEVRDSPGPTKSMVKKGGKKLVLSEYEATVLKKRMRDMYDAVLSYQDENGRYLSQLFVELPSAAQYPDYYEIISEPTCLRMIDKNIQDGKYLSEQQFLLDFEIMFENAKHYNEVGSQVHQDALTLDKVLKKKRKSLGRPQFGQLESGSSTSPAVKQTTPSSKQQTTPTKSTRSFSSARTSQTASTTDVKELCKELYNSIKDYTDITGRYLCGIFQKLPSKTDYPDYYSLIKRPIDMAKISTKVHAEQYSTLEECFQDFVVMFDNACKYNDPDSQVYKDSLVLLRELFATKLELLGDCETHVPDVRDLVQRMIEELYDAVIHHQDDEGRCYSDSLINLPNTQEVDESGQKKYVLSLPTIGKLVKKRYYKRLDKFQDDLFTFFEKVRMNRLDSEVYDDAVDLQQYFIQQRDLLCKEGERFVSPAISQTKRHLAHELDEERKRKAKEEAAEDEEDANKETSKKADEEHVTNLSEIEVGNQEISVGDYVYVDAGDRFIIAVEKIWMDMKETKWIRGPWFYRPEQTVHKAGRKFMEKEVLRSDKNTPVNINQIKGLCYVMYVKNFMKSKPLDFDENDVFVCECKYNSRRQSFKKIKGWPTHGHNVKHIPREQPLVLNRAPLLNEKTTRKTGVVKGDDEELIASLYQTTEEKKNLQIDVPIQEGFISYEQYWAESGCYKLGDTVYTQTDEGYWTLSRIDKIWSDRQGTAYFCGTTFIKPEDTQHLPTHMFYDKEVFHIPTEEVQRMTSIIRKCCVLPIREYMRCRPTDVPEEDVFLCESRYDEDDGGHFRKLKGLKRPTLSTNVYEEEFYFFEENLSLVKRPSPLLVRDMSELKRDDRILSPALVGADTELGKGSKKRSRAQSGFLLFSTERRNVIRKQNPEYSFGDISRVVGTEWKNLNSAKREDWEARASFQSAKTVSTMSQSAYSAGPGIAYDCLWQGCDYQYEDLNELIIHVLESGGHLIKMENGLCPCLWRNCERLKRGFRPFTSLTKLIRHCREMHLKGPPRRVEFHEKSKNYFPKNQAASQPEPLSPDVESVNPPQQPGNPAYVGVVPSPTPSHVLNSAQSVNINSNLMDPQYSNVMRLPTPGLAQTMMGISTTYGSQGMPTMASNNSTNIQRPGSVANGSAAVTTMNQFAQMVSMGVNVSQQQLANSLQQFSSPYQQHTPQDPQQVNQLPPPYPNVQNIQQSLQPQQQTQLPQPRQTAPVQQDQRQQPQQGVFPTQTAQFMETQPTETQMAPLFHSPPPRQQKLLHSDAYLRYIEGLRDGTPHLSNWNPSKPDVSKMTQQQQAQLPVQWLGSAYNPHQSTLDALWALREHMLNDALKLSKFTQNYT